MRLSRIYGVILRYLFYFRHSLDRMSDAFYWPTVDLLLWGLTSTYFRQFSSKSSLIILTVISGILLWIIVWRGQYEITVNLLEELWNKNLINFFSSPLKFSEWIVSVLIIGIIKAVLSLSFAMLVAYILYQVKIFYLGYYLPVFVFLLLMTGWWVGFIVAGIIFRGGTKVQNLAWTAVMIISPFSAAYYPVSILPLFAQKIAAFVPTSYVFEAGREILFKGTVDYKKLLICFFLNLFYLFLSLIFLKRSFKKVLEKKGLVKVF